MSHGRAKLQGHVRRIVALVIAATVTDPLCVVVVLLKCAVFRFDEVGDLQRDLVGVVTHPVGIRIIRVKIEIAAAHVARGSTQVESQVGIYRGTGCVDVSVLRFGKGRHVAAQHEIRHIILCFKWRACGQRRCHRERHRHGRCHEGRSRSERFNFLITSGKGRNVVNGVDHRYRALRPTVLIVDEIAGGFRGFIDGLVGRLGFRRRFVGRLVSRLIRGLIGGLFGRRRLIGRLGLFGRLGLGLKFGICFECRRSRQVRGKRDILVFQGLIDRLGVSRLLFLHDLGVELRRYRDIDRFGHKGTRLVGGQGIGAKGHYYIDSARRGGVLLGASCLGSCQLAGGLHAQVSNAIGRGFHRRALGTFERTLQSGAIAWIERIEIGAFHARGIEGHDIGSAKAGAFPVPRRNIGQDEVVAPLVQHARRRRHIDGESSVSAIGSHERLAHRTHRGGYRLTRLGVHQRDRDCTLISHFVIDAIGGLCRSIIRSSGRKGAQLVAALHLNRNIGRHSARQGCRQLGQGRFRRKLPARFLSGNVMLVLHALVNKENAAGQALDQFLRGALQIFAAVLGVHRPAGRQLIGSYRKHGAHILRVPAANEPLLAAERRANVAQSVFVEIRSIKRENHAVAIGRAPEVTALQQILSRRAFGQGRRQGKSASVHMIALVRSLQRARSLKAVAYVAEQSLLQF